MSGRQIRWGSLGRAAAIGAAVLLGVISLPSLLEGGSPPPLPKDVGLAQVPPPSPAPPAPVAAPAALAAPAPAKRSGRKPSGDRRALRKRHIHGGRPKDDRNMGTGTDGSPVAGSAPTVALAPAPGHTPAPRRGEFRFER